MKHCVTAAPHSQLFFSFPLSQLQNPKLLFYEPRNTLNTRKMENYDSVFSVYSVVLQLPPLSDKNVLLLADCFFRMPMSDLQ